MSIGKLIVGRLKSRFRPCFSLAIISFSLSLTAAAAQSTSTLPLYVDESNITIHLLPEAVLYLPVVNQSGKVLEGSIEFGLAGYGGLVMVESLVKGKIHSDAGSTLEKVPWPQLSVSGSTPSQLSWNLFFYSITPDPGFDFAPVRGAVQCGPILRDSFEVQLAYQGEPSYGGNYPVVVRVDDPSSGKPYTGVPVKLKFQTFQQDFPRAYVEAGHFFLTTDRFGYARTVITLPANTEIKGGRIGAEVALGQFHERAESEFFFPDRTKLILTTDKPIYQPGQTVHMRLQAFGPDQRPKEKAQVTVSVRDGARAEQFHATLETSKFGVASTDWELPRKLTLGDYSAAAQIEMPTRYQSNYAKTYAAASFRVAKYELPAFTVEAVTDRPYYFPGDDIRVVVRARYLTGQPVKRGKVKVVLTQGELDAEGKFVALISRKMQLPGKEQLLRERFRDIPETAYVTDASTGRTEQAQFRFRLTAEAVHLYFLNRFSRYLVNGYPYFGVTTEPVHIYLAAYYADGNPASVEGDIGAVPPNAQGEFDKNPDLTTAKMLKHFRTNAYGVARVDLPPLPENLLGTSRPAEGRRPWEHDLRDFWIGDSEGPGRGRESTVREHTAHLFAWVHDGQGRGGSTDEEIGVSRAQDYLRVETDHTLYHPGQPVHVSVFSTAKFDTLVLEVLGKDGVLASKLVDVDSGTSQLNFPYGPEFQGHLQVRAFSLTGPRPFGTPLIGSAQIIFPARRELRVDLRTQRTTFRPGETVAADFHVTAPDGRGAMSALGLLVYDRAVEDSKNIQGLFWQNSGFSLSDYFDPDYGFSSRAFFPPGYRLSVGNVAYRDLLNLNPNRPFPAGLDLVAEAILNARMSASAGYWENWTGFSNGTGAFAEWKLNSPTQYSLWDYVMSIEQTIKPLREALIRLYTTSGVFPTNDRELVSILKGAGMYTGSPDDPWTGPADPKINTGYSRIYPQALRDPWMVPYHRQFSLEGPFEVLRLVSDGLDKTPGTADDFAALTIRWPYFATVGELIDVVVAEYELRTGTQIRDYQTLSSEMKKSGIDLDALRDPWGSPYSYTFAVPGNPYLIEVRSAGPDRKLDTADDVLVWKSSGADTGLYSVWPVLPKPAASLRPANPIFGYPTTPSAERKSPAPSSESTSEAAAPEKKGVEIAAPKASAKKDKETGGISGTLTYIDQGVVVGAIVQAFSPESGLRFKTNSDSQGKYELSAVPPGVYRLEIRADGYDRHFVLQVPIHASGITSVGPVSLKKSSGTYSMIQVAGQAAALGGRNLTALPEVSRQGERGTKQLFTPRLRQYFPETLLWRPELLTDPQGNAHIQFSMADTLTRWKMSAIASNLEGQVGLAELDLRTFQPFFLEFEPPAILTKGDRITLPVVLRNYTGKRQAVKAAMKPEPWFSLRGESSQSLSVAANDEARATFSYRADTVTRHGKQQVSARNDEVGDAVERGVTVHPDGEEVSHTVAKILAAEGNSLTFSIPANAIPGSVDGELRIYPNLVAHVIDAATALERHPEACWEMSLSRGFANLMVLRLLKAREAEPGSAGALRAEIVARATQAIQEIYQRTINIQKADGSFTDWEWEGWSRSTAALTAYNLRFLVEADGAVSVDPQALKRAANYLASHQEKSGAWSYYPWPGDVRTEDSNLTAYVIRTLAESAGRLPAQDRQDVNSSLNLGMRYLEAQIASWQDPYLVGNYAIAASASGRREFIGRARSLLESLSHDEGPTTYWNLEADTSPFYAWGQAARLTATALAVEALSLLPKDSTDSHTAEQIERGLQFLLKNKDSSMSWYTPQATQNVLEAIVAALPSAPADSPASTATIVLNGRTVSTIRIPPANSITGPVAVELPRFFRRGENALQVVRPGSAPAMNAALITSYYLPWSAAAVAGREGERAGDTWALRMKVKFDRTDPNVGDTVKCQVEVERTGFKGYGMMAAEIGLPPAAEVDRESLNYFGQVEPDRVRFYLWPSESRTRFNFTFRPRCRLDAMTAPSFLYDSNNPEASDAVAPVRFTVH
jgi:hypothetical protein